MNYDIQTAIKIVEPFIKLRESYAKSLPNGSCTAYQTRLPNGKYDVPTIGWGTTVYSNGVRVKMGDVITRQEAQYELDFEMIKKANQLNNVIDFDVSNHEFAAMLSFSYNAGVGKKGKLGDAGLQNKLFFHTLKNTGDTAKAASQLQVSTLTAGGVPLNGLIIRRKGEADLMRLALVKDEKKKSSSNRTGISKSITNSVRNIYDYFGFFFTGK